eukprot:243530-Karenia_brevis.AAC.1
MNACQAVGLPIELPVYMSPKICRVTSGCQPMQAAHRLQKLYTMSNWPADISSIIAQGADGNEPKIHKAVQTEDAA